VRFTNRNLERIERIDESVSPAVILSVAKDLSLRYAAKEKRDSSFAALTQNDGGGLASHLPSPEEPERQCRLYALVDHFAVAIREGVGVLAFDVNGAEHAAVW
jgi:hypothetical protein